MSSDTAEITGPLTGWEATAPREDTILRRFILAQCAFQRITGEAMDATIVETDRFIAVDTGRPATMLNFAVLRQPLLGPALDSTMDEIGAVFAGVDKRGWVALYSPLPTPDLSPWGWTLAGHPPLQLRSPLAPVLDAGNIRVERVSTTEEMATFEQVMIGGFEMEEMRGAAAGSLFGPRLLDDDRFAAWLGYVDGAAGAGACSIEEAGIVVVTAVATVPEARRKGAGLAVTQAASRPELGLPSILFSSDEGRPIYERLGFVPILRGAFWYRNR